MRSGPGYRTKRNFIIASLCVLLAAGASSGQGLVANDDEFGVPFGEPLLVEAFGVLENDTLGEESAGESGATAELVSDVSHGTLDLASDGSFDYSPGQSFNGIDSFVYRAVSVPEPPAQATVTLTACTGGPDVFACWNEAAFLTKVTALGFPYFREGFENDSIWGEARSPFNALEVTSGGIHWRANDVFRSHFPEQEHDPIASAPNQLTTGSGAAITGQWGLFDRNHGYATGSSGSCDIDTPPAACLFNDGFSGTRVAGLGPLNGVGAYFDGFHGANVSIVLDGDEANPIKGGKLGGPLQFFGAIVTDPAGFTRFEFRETDGKVGQALLIFADDFTIVGDPIALPALSSRALIALGVAICASFWPVRNRRVKGSPKA